MTGSGHWCPTSKRRAIYKSDAHRCVYCGEHLGDSVESERTLLTLDHLLPRELGGTHHATNLVTACRICNSMKRDLSVRAFLEFLKNRGHDIDAVRRRIKNARRRHTKLS